MTYSAQLPQLFATRCQKQNGSALVVGMIVLLLLTMLGIATMRTSALEERMAGSLRDNNIAFQSAEGALRETLTTTFSDMDYTGSTAGFGLQITDYKNGGGTSITEYEYWKDQFNWAANSINATKPASAGQAPKYYVELVPASTGIWKAGERAKRAYRITVNATGASDRSQAIVQGTVIQEE